jgi:predicted outer membrane protein
VRAAVLLLKTKAMKTAVYCLAVWLFFAACQSPEQRAFERQTPDTASLDSASATRHDDSITADKRTLGSINTSDELMNESDLDDYSSAFLKAAAAGNYYEVKLAQLALKQGGTPAVNTLARQLEKDHSLARKELEDLSVQLNVLLPATLPTGAEKALQELGKLKGAAFDARYLALLAEEHRKAIALHADAAANSRSKKVVDFASAKLPALRRHAEMVDRIKIKPMNGKPY